MYLILVLSKILTISEPVIANGTEHRLQYRREMAAGVSKYNIHDMVLEGGSGIEGIAANLAVCFLAFPATYFGMLSRIIKQKRLPLV